MNTKHDTFIGRWVIFHKGHLEIIKKVYNKNKRPILILIMNTEETPLAYIREINIQNILSKNNIPHEIIIIPPIASVNWGRNVGYETNYIEVDEKIQKISNTNIQQKIKNNDNSWINDIP